MRLSQHFGKTHREDPGDAESESHRLLLRAGMIAPLTAGIYSIMPLGWRAIHKIVNIIREEMDEAGGQELHLPVLQPSEVWQETGRLEAFGQTLFQMKDRRGRNLVLAPTHEEVITDLVRQNVRSYRDLPLKLYQIQTKFRDEPRPRGGLLRVREFDMKDMYSFDADEAGLDKSYRRLVEAYHNIYTRCGLPSMAVEADSGAIGGKDSHEFILLADRGEDTIIHCSSCDYAANQERAASVKEAGGEGDEELPIETIETPGKATIADVADFLGISARQTLKAVFYAVDGQVTFVLVRGDLEVNEVKLKNTLKATTLRLASHEEVAAAGLVAGAASPIGVEGVKVVGDESISNGTNFVIGANKPGFHHRNANSPRDFKVDILADVVNAEPGHGCPTCGSILQASRGIEVGHVFKLGTVFSQTLGAEFLDATGGSKPVVMGCYGIGVGRLLAAAIEQNHDDNGIVWPKPIAPYDVSLIVLGADQSVEVGKAADALYEELEAAGVEVLYDDRDERPGVKFNDADLLGMPVRLTVSKRNLDQGVVEMKGRTEKEPSLVPQADVVAMVSEAIRED